jgi:ArsR family transcriptional regulator
MSKINPYSRIGKFLRQISHPTRLRILQEIGTGEACVCHLEAQLGLRQSYLSQHLMALRDADILRTEKDGRFVYYRLTNTDILDMVNAAAEILHIEAYKEAANKDGKKACSCPKCCQKD